MAEQPRIHNAEDTTRVSKYGIELSIYPPNATFSSTRVTTETGHFEEFSNQSRFTYFVISGQGTFVLDDEKHEVGPGSLVDVPPETRIHYFANPEAGGLDMWLVVSPPFQEENETHIRLIEPEESPYRN